MATVVLAFVVASLSFISGAIALTVFCIKNVKWCKETLSRSSSSSDLESPTARTSRKDEVSARLPSLISIEIILLLWYLMGAIPLMLFFWFYSEDDIYDMAGSVVFVSSFIPLFTTHIIRIWLLNLKYKVTSLSMLNQLGMMKWRDIDHMIWTKIYYKYKWSHNIKTLMIISMISNIIITILYAIFVAIDINTRSYLNAFIFASLTCILIVGVIPLKSFTDPFNIFREEIIILLVWLIALFCYAILYWILWPHLEKVLTNKVWTVTSTFFGAAAALISILIHFHFNEKSIETVQNNPPQLSVIVSTKEGLEIFLKFLVTELSVENLEFFTLSMRWRHRLVIRHERKEKKMQQLVKLQKNSLKSLKIAVTDVDKSDTPKSDKNFNNKMTSLSQFPQDVKQITNNILKATSERLLIRPKAKEAETHLKQLPFPILTFEFLDKDAGAQTSSRGQSFTEVSHVPEFSHTRVALIEGTTLETPVLSPQIPNHTVSKEKHAYLTPALAPCRSTKFRETAVSVFFDQYDFMHNMQEKRRMTLQSMQLSDHDHDDDDHNKKYTVSFEAGGITPLNNGVNPLQYTPDPNGKILRNKPKTSLQITHRESYSDDGVQLALSPIPATWTKLLNLDSYNDDTNMYNYKKKSEALQTVVDVSDNEDEVSQNTQEAEADAMTSKKEEIEMKKKAKEDDYNWDDDSTMYNQEWTQGFMSSKTVDYDRFHTLSEDINISSRARRRLRKFFDTYPTVKLFCNVLIAEYDNAFESAWKNVWQNLNDSLRRFRESKFYQEWLQSNAAMQYNGLDVM